MSKRLIFITLVYLAWLPVLMVQKPVFMLYHYDQSLSFSALDWLLVMWHGLKLDAAVAAYLTLIPLLFTLASVWIPGRRLQTALAVYFGIVVGLVAIIFGVDMALYSFWGFRLDATVLFYIAYPADAVSSVPISLIVRQTFLILMYGGGVFWIFRRLIVPAFPKEPNPRLLAPIVFVLCGGLLFIPMRGSVTTSTANVGMVYFSPQQFLNHAAINPVFSLLASLSKQQNFASQFRFFPEEECQEIFQRLMPGPSPDSLLHNKPQLLRTTRPDILLVVLEGISANTIESLGGAEGVTPCLDRLCEEGVLFTNVYAGSFRTDRGLVSILNGYLSQPTTSIMKYPAKSETLPSIALSLAEQGYVADMLYGGDIDFTNMKSYFYHSGYSHITSDVDFPIRHRLNKWGANDNITFEHLYHTLSEQPDNAPLRFTTFLTLSSHEPFEVPYHHLDDPYLNAVAFTDSCIGAFMDKLRQTPRWENTLVIFVSDHGYRFPANLSEHEPARFHIPILWVGGAVKAPARINTIISQTDLAATLLSQLHIDHRAFPFSRDILDPGQHEYAYYTFSNGFGYVDTTGFSVFNNESNLPIQQSPTPSLIRIQNGQALLQTTYTDMGHR